MPENIGNDPYFQVNEARRVLFNQGEIAQLTYGSFEVSVNSVKALESETIEIRIPVAYRQGQPTLSTRKYGKEDLLSRYYYLASHQLSANGILQLVTIIEALLSDSIRSVVVRYPQKLGPKRAIPLQAVLEARSIEDVHLRATDSLLNELSYKSPAEFAEACNALLSINLFECPDFHKYVELKATRDIYIHNRGIANETYLRKAGSHARAKSGDQLHVDIQYFLQSYESCLSLVDWLEVEFDERWHSSDRENYIENLARDREKANDLSAKASDEGDAEQTANQKVE